MRRLCHEGRRVTCWSPSGSAVDSHAGCTETSVMLALRPESVRLDLLEAGDTRPLREIMPLLVRSGVVAVSANGVLGDPRGASRGRRPARPGALDGRPALGVRHMDTSLVTASDRGPLAHLLNRAVVLDGGLRRGRLDPPRKRW
ncbi:creatininase family protein [Kutzneria sp. 744]|uniref:creatininase family protein n=1 Tax=Kutzneria sp. (strain 744) TaxID=345341 RepID=UPI0021008E2D|nr:creatininase family protein [Kutzneria sp. 744]